MPELPEVEIARRQLEKWLAGRTIREARVLDARVLGARGGAGGKNGAGAGTPDAAARALAGQRVRSIERRGKWLHLVLARGEVYAHLGMTGKWVLRRADDPDERFEKLRLETSGERSVRYVDARVFGRVLVTNEAPAACRELGPDPLVDGLDAKALGARLAGRRRSVKEALMDQTVLAGIGNIHAQEALFRAGIDPRRRADRLDASDLRRLAAGIRKTIALGLADGTKQSSGDGDMTYVEEDETANPFLVYGRAGSRCPRCRRETLQRLVQGGRSTVHCVRCQR